MRPFCTGALTARGSLLKSSCPARPAGSGSPAVSSSDATARESSDECESARCSATCENTEVIRAINPWDSPIITRHII